MMRSQSANPGPEMWNVCRAMRRKARRNTMKVFGKTAILALSISSGVAGSALAQAASSGSMSNGSMSNGSMASGSMSSGSMSGSMDHDKMKSKKKTKHAMT